MKARTPSFAALFSGKGSFNFSPPTELEQDQLYRFYESKMLTRKFTSLILFFADSTLNELEGKLDFSARAVSRESKEKVKDGLQYRGDLIEREADWLYIRHSTGWYPRHGNRQDAIFDLTFHTPKKFTFACVGDKISSQEKDDVFTTRWTTPRIRNASFNIGIFKEHEIKDERVAPVAVLMAEGGHHEIGRALAAQGISSGRNRALCAYAHPGQRHVDAARSAAAAVTPERDPVQRSRIRFVRSQKCRLERLKIVI